MSNKTKTSLAQGAKVLCAFIDALANVLYRFRECVTLYDAEERAGVALQMVKFGLCAREDIYTKGEAAACAETSVVTVLG